MKKYDNGLVKAEPIKNIPMNFDFASLYPNVVQTVTGEGREELNRLLKLMERKKKMEKILNNINNEDII